MRASDVWNVTDDEPAPPQDVVAYAAELMGVAPPPEQDFDTAELSPMARSFYGENKRVANRKLKAELGVDARLSHLPRGPDRALGRRRGPPQRARRALSAAPVPKAGGARRPAALDAFRALG